MWHYQRSALPLINEPDGGYKQIILTTVILKDINALILYFSSHLFQSYILI